MHSFIIHCYCDAIVLVEFIILGIREVLGEGGGKGSSWGSGVGLNEWDVISVVLFKRKIRINEAEFRPHSVEP